MENHIVAYKDGKISDIMVKEGDLVSANMVLVKIE
jgi:biotin carboxyl carrier protein